MSTARHIIDITAADRVVEALIKAGWRPTVEQPAAEHHDLPNADTPSDAEVEAAARALSAFNGTNWDSLGTVGRETYSDAARAALVASRKAARHE